MSVKICPQCSAEFQCINEHSGCWCEELSLSTETLKKLREKYTNCLCPACLKGYTGIPPKNTCDLGEK